MTKKDALFASIIGAEVGLAFQPLIINLWPNIYKFVFDTFGVEMTRDFVIHASVVVFFTLLAPLALYVLSLIAKFIKVAYQFGKFAAVGASNTFLDLGLLNLAIIFADLPAGSTKLTLVATVTALISTVNSYFWNKFWTFEAGKREEKQIWEVVKFYAVTGVAALVNGTITSIVAKQIIGDADATSGNLPATAGKIVGILSAFLINFLGYKFFVFKKKEELPPQEIGTV